MGVKQENMLRNRRQWSSSSWRAQAPGFIARQFEAETRVRVPECHSPAEVVCVANAGRSRSSGKEPPIPSPGKAPRG